MRLSPETVEILNNFYRINESIVFNPGNVIRTMGSGKTLLAEATVPETFEREFGIYNLKEFLTACSIVGDPELIFDDDEYVLLKNGSSQIKYYFSEPSLIEAPPKDVRLSDPSPDVVFTLENNYLAKMLKMATFDSDLTNWLVEINGNRSEINLNVVNVKDTSKPSYTFNVGETASQFSFMVSLEKFKFISGDYDVVISSKLLAKFTNNDRELMYYLPMSPDSTFTN